MGPPGQAGHVPKRMGPPGEAGKVPESDSVSTREVDYDDDYMGTGGLLDKRMGPPGEAGKIPDSDPVSTRDLTEETASEHSRNSKYILNTT